MVARLVAKALQDELKGAFVVENKPGATSNIASETVAAAAPLTMNKFVFPKQKFDPLKSFEPAAKISSAPGVLAVSPKMPVKTYKEFEELAKKKPNALSYGTTGAGGTRHMAHGTWRPCGWSSSRAWTCCMCPTRAARACSTT